MYLRLSHQQQSQFLWEVISVPFSANNSDTSTQSTDTTPITAYP